MLSSMQIFGNDSPVLTVLASLTLVLSIVITGAVVYLTYDNWKVNVFQSSPRNIKLLKICTG